MQDYIALVHSLLVITTPISLLSAYATPFELAHALRTSKVTRLFVQPALLGNALKAAKEVGLPEDCIFVLEGRHNGRHSFQDLIDRVRKRGTPRVPVKPATRDTLAYLVFSSGTSGLPKGTQSQILSQIFADSIIAVMISHGNLWATMFGHAVTKQTEDDFLKVRGSAPGQIRRLKDYFRSCLRRQQDSFLSGLSSCRSTTRLACIWRVSGTSHCRRHT